MKRNRMWQDSSLIETRVSDHFFKKNYIDFKTLSMGLDEIRRAKKKKKIFIINLLVINFCKRRMVRCCVDLILDNKSNDPTEWISGYATGFLGSRVKLGNQGTQGSFQTSIEKPSPTRKYTPLIIKGFNFPMALQVWVAYFLGSSLSQRSIILYLLRIALQQGLSLLEATIQDNFAKKASLNFFAFLNLKPPRFVGLQRWSQDFQARNLPFSFLELHQNLRVVASSLSHTTVGTSKVEKV